MNSKRYRAGLAVLTALLIVFGCSDPVSNPPKPESPFREGDTLRSPTTNLTISANGGVPWIIVEDYVIPEGVTVTVEPGAEIMVAGLNWIDVQGKIVAEASSASPIIFTSAHTEPDLGQWRGIKLRNASEGSVFRYCVFSYGAYFDSDTLGDRGRDAQNFRGMLAIWDSSPTIEHCVVTNNQNNAIAIKGSASLPRIRYNVLTGNDASAVRADQTVTQIEQLDVRYNNVAENSAPGFILSNDNPDTSTGTLRVFGDLTEVNSNLDSCDSRFNIDLPPLFVDPAEELQTRFADYGLESCSPCVNAGPLDGDFDSDGTPADMGSQPYSQQTFELRGRLEDDLASATYRMSCDVVVPPGVTVTVPAGTRIEATGKFNMEIYGRLLVQGTAGSPVEICPCQTIGQDIVGGIIFFDRGDDPSVIQHMVVRDFDEVLVNKSGVRFENVEFINGFQGGVEVETGTTNLEDAVMIQSCSFTNVGTQAIEVLASSAKVSNSWINGSRGRGLTLEGVHDGVEIMNTIIEACSTSGVSLTDFCDPLMVNNTIVGSGYHGVHMQNNCNPEMLNNIITGCGRYGVYAQFSSFPQLNYNDVYNNGLRDVVPANYSPATLDVGESISANPQFAGSDYRLAPGSPCINAGHPDAQYNDADQTRNDMGAWGGPGGTGIGAGLRSGGLASRY
ncbi:MAG: right-handed parallel beta-helix repeat-containing protein [Calditrichaeota bacterium]|nr:right-handed parallel beta-helix repeat-containing protein [Calditrichota bacterium]MCB9391315.1 right-handed parallel beta-helix repeat-containing protein [Calditrichota bacterium]